MKYSTLGKQFFEYSWGALGVSLILFWSPVLFLFGLGGILMFITGDFLLGLYEIGIVLFPIPLLLIAFLTDRVSKNIWVRGLIIYFFWFIIALVEIFVYMMTMGGLSMAVAEGVGGSFWYRMADYFIGSMRGILFAQPILIIFTAIGMYQLKKK